MHENAAWAQNRPIIGLDEAGRGCFAGPVVAAAVMLPIGTSYRNLKDSKTINESERLTAYHWITQHCAIGVGIANHRMIDQHNIYAANMIAMQKALLNLLATTHERPAAILTDAVPLKIFDTAYGEIPIHHFAKGERYSASIAAASIVAKVVRDALMQKLDTLFPGYALAEHKGYGTEIHTNAIRELGPSIIHRTTFLHNLKTEQEMEFQGNLFT